MARNQESINMVASLLVVSAGKHKGKTVPEIQEACPSLSRQAIQRILKKPGFKRVVNAAAYPPQYWFDVTESDPFRAAPARDDSPKMSELQTKVLNRVRESPKSLHGLVKGIAKNHEPVRDMIGLLIEAIEDNEPPDPTRRDSIRILADYYLEVGMRLEKIMADPLYSTPEWWKLLKEDKK